MNHFIFEGHLCDVDTRRLANFIVTKFVFEKELGKDLMSYTFQYDKVESIKVVKNPYPDIILGLTPLEMYNLIATIFKLDPYTLPQSYRVLGLNTDEEYKIKMQPIYEKDYKRKDN